MTVGLGSESGFGLVFGLELAIAAAAAIPAIPMVAPLAIEVEPEDDFDGFLPGLDEAFDGFDGLEGFAGVAGVSDRKLSGSPKNAAEAPTWPTALGSGGGLASADAA